MTNPRRRPAPAPAPLERPSVAPMASDRFETVLKRVETAFRTLLSGTACAWNEVEPEVAAVCDFAPLPIAAAANAAASGSGTITEEGDWTIPFGDYPGTGFRKNGEEFPVMQRVDAQAANDMAGGWRSWLQKLAIWIVKVPVYRGHPDKLREMTDDQKEAIQRGSLKSISAECDRLHFAVALNEQGAADAATLGSFSPFWGLKDTGETSPAGIPIWRPCLVYSIGITDKPVIKAAAINEEKNNQETPEMKELIAKFRADLKLDDSVTDEQVLRLAQEHYSNIQQQLWNMTSALEAEKAKRAEAEVAATAAKKEIDLEKAATVAAQASVAAANQALEASKAEAEAAKPVLAAANELKTKAGATVDAAITAGKILPADREAWLDRFQKDPIEAAVAAANEQKKLKTTETAAAAANSRDGLPPLAQFEGIVRAHMSATKANWHTAWNACAQTHKAIYDLMQQPKSGTK